MKFNSRHLMVTVMLLVSILSTLFYIEVLLQTKITLLYNIIILGLDLFLVACLVFMFGVARIELGRIPCVITTVYLIHTMCVAILQDANLSDVCDVMTWPLLFLVSYVLFKGKNFSDRKFLLAVTIIISPLYVLGIYLVIQHLREVIDTTSDMFPTYVLLSLIPLILFSKKIQKSSMRYIYLIVSICVLFANSKRSSFLAVLISFVAYFLTDLLIYKNNLNGKMIRLIKYVMIAAFVVGIGYEIMSYLGLDVLERMEELSSDGGSGRDYIWTTVIYAYLHSNTFEKIFGHGYHTVSKFMFDGNLAHNDYLNILYDYGVIGLTLYVIFIIDKLILFVKLLKLKSMTAPSYASSIAITLILSMVSYFAVQSRIINFIAIFWAYMYAKYRRSIEGRE